MQQNSPTMLSLTLGIGLLALHEVDEHVGHVVQLAHALGVEIRGGVVEQPGRVRSRIVDTLRCHDPVQLPVQILADHPHPIGQCLLAVNWTRHQKNREQTENRESIMHHGTRPKTTEQYEKHDSDLRQGRVATNWCLGSSRRHAEPNHPHSSATLEPKQSFVRSSCPLVPIVQRPVAYFLYLFYIYVLSLSMISHCNNCSLV